MTREIAKRIVSGEMMDFPNTFDEFAKEYGFKDKKEVYTNGSELISVFRVKQWLEHIKALEQEPRWIPVSERLPNDRDWYLGIFKEHDTGWINPLPFICDYVGKETKATTKEYWILRGFTDGDEHIDYYFNLECVAWMPLPQPYSEVEE